MATRLGDHRFDDRLDDLSAPARAAGSSSTHRTGRLDPENPYPRLSRDGQIDYEILRHHLESSIWLADTFRPFETIRASTAITYGECLSAANAILTPSRCQSQECGGADDTDSEVVDMARSTIKNRPSQSGNGDPTDRGAIGFYEANFSSWLANRLERPSWPARHAIVAALHRHIQFLKTDVLPRSNDHWRIGPEKFEKKLSLELDAGLSAGRCSTKPSARPRASRPRWP